MVPRVASVARSPARLVPSVPEQASSMVRVLSPPWRSPLAPRLGVWVLLCGFALTAGKFEGRVDDQVPAMKSIYSDSGSDALALNVSEQQITKKEHEGGEPLAMPREIERRLQAVVVIPSTVQVAVGNLPAVATGDTLTVYAGVRYREGLQLFVPGSTFSTALHGVARLRIVPPSAAASLGACAQPEIYVPGGWGFVNSALVLSVVNGSTQLASVGNISFTIGGSYRVCYSYDGTFQGLTSALLAAPSALMIRGAIYDCKADLCLEEHRWFCFVQAESPSPQFSCIVQFTGAMLGNDLDTATALSWGATVVADASQTFGWECGVAAPSSRLVPGYRTALVGTLGREFALQALAGTTGVSVEACYCAGVDGADPGSTPCDADSEFVQPVGRVLFFAAWSCDLSCRTRYNYVVPGSLFSVNIDCAGSLACGNGTSNRIKLLDPSPLGENDLSSWVTSAGCVTKPGSQLQLLPRNCRNGSIAECGGLSGEFNGGVDRGSKIFSGIVMGSYAVAGVPMSRRFDVCFCDEQCDAPQYTDAATRFHKVGAILVQPMQLLRNTEFGAATGIDIVGVRGDIMVDGTRNVPTTPLPAQIKLLWDNLRSKTSDDCRNSMDIVTFDPGQGPTCLDLDHCTYKASVQATDAPDWFTGVGLVVTFNDGGAQGERVKFKQPGVLVVCYCGVLADGTGAQARGSCYRDQGVSSWFLMSRTLIRGPCVTESLGRTCTEQEWTYFVGVIFELTVIGMGLRGGDKLRIIPSTSSCIGNPDGGGESTVMKGCPEACNPLSLPNTYVFGGGEGKDDLDVQLTTSTTVACNVKNEGCRLAKLQEIRLQKTYSVWRFDADPTLKTGDVVILDNVTGGTQEENNLLMGNVGLNPLGWRVTATSDPLEFTVPAFLDRGPAPLPLIQTNGGWRRQSEARTKQELKATEAKAALQVCWGSGPDTYHARAGHITFQNPLAMPKAMLSPSSSEGDKAAPSIISFATASGGAAAISYKSALNSMQLRLVFEDVSKALPLSADADANPLPQFAPVDNDELRDAKQFVCGILFSELWSDDAKGFPLPQGCYYASQMDNRRELFLVFEPLNGLEAGKNYQIVLNVRVQSGATLTDRVLSIFSMDDVVQAPYGVVEMGDARLTRTIRRAAGIGEPRFMSSGGLQLLNPVDSFRDIMELTTDPTSLVFRLQGDGNSPITPGTVLRLIMRPLSLWNVNPSCRAQCFPHRQRVCGNIELCVGESVVPLGSRNVVKLTLPLDMTQIYGATVQHTVRVSEIALMRRGFFGTRIGAQVSPPTEGVAHYVEGSGAWLWKAPSNDLPPATLANVVSLQGEGNDKPFFSDLDNLLYVTLVLGASLRSELNLGDAAFIVQLPTGYICRAVSPVPMTLAALGQVPPQGRGSLPASDANSTAGTWVLKYDRSCEYQLYPGELLPAGSSIYFGILVNQPQGPLQKLDVANQWTVTLMSRGWYRKSTQATIPQRFAMMASADQGDVFDVNVAVLGKLSYDNIQPLSFRAADQGSALQVFFRPQQRSGYGGKVLVVAPEGFNFATGIPDLCVVSRLPGGYYYSLVSLEKTSYLPIVQSCFADCKIQGGCLNSMLNRANIAMLNSLQPDMMYGFRIDIINKASYSSSDLDGWAIMTSDGFGNLLDASFPSAAFNPANGGAREGWGVYKDTGQATSVILSFSSLLPYSIKQQSSSLTLANIVLPSTVVTTCRMTAPDGYQLIPAGFIYTRASIPGTTASWPGQVPWQSMLANGGSSNPAGNLPQNVFIWSAAEFVAGQKYGFISKINIPDQAVTSTSLAFFLEFGWDRQDFAERPIAWVLPLPPISVLMDFSVGYQTNVVGAKNAVTFRMQTASALPRDGKLKVQAPAGFVFEEQCRLLPAPSKVTLPSLVCVASPQTGPGGTILGTTITLTAASGPFPSGLIEWQLQTRNPTTPRTNRAGQPTKCGFEECWTVVSLDASGAIVDAGTSAVGFGVNVAMPKAMLVDLTAPQRLATDRSDRPGSFNNLVFAFQLANQPTSVGELVLTGPSDFVFDEDCLQGLRIYQSQTSFDASVFGYLDWIPGYDQWEAAARVNSCTSVGSTVRMSVELGLRARKLYVFRIRVASNPSDVPIPNLWTIEYSGESCVPFAGFDLWTFADMSLLPTTTAANSETHSVPNLVTFRFRPHKEVIADPKSQGLGGMIRIYAPAGFAAVTVGDVTESCAASRLVELASGVAFQPGKDVRCVFASDSAQLLTFELIGSRNLEGGKMYELVAQFYNPRAVSTTAGLWKVSSFSDSSALSGSLDVALDTSLIVGFPITTPMYRWIVRPPAGEQHVGGLAEGIILEFAISSIVLGGSTLEVTAPIGFELAVPRSCDPFIGFIVAGSSTEVGTTSSLIECAELVWTIAPIATAASWNLKDGICSALSDVRSHNYCVASIQNVSVKDVPLNCSLYTFAVCSFPAEGRLCNKFNYIESGPPFTPPSCNGRNLILHFGSEDVLLPTSLVRMQLSSTNPATMLDIGENFWGVTIYDSDGVLVASGAELGWALIPKLLNPSVRISGALQASKTMSQLTVKFTPQTNANEVLLTVVQPPGFDFSLAALVASQRAFVIKAADQNSVTLGTLYSPLVGGQDRDVTILLNNITIGEPGPAVFGLLTSLNSLKADESVRIEGDESFVVPGFVEVVSATLKMVGSSSTGAGAYIATFKPRTNEVATATFTLRFGSAVAALDELEIVAPPYLFDASSVMLTALNANTEGDLRLNLTSVGDSLGAIALRLRLMEAIVPKTLTYQLQMKVQTGAVADGSERWRFQTFPAGSPPGALPSNTNDASTLGFKLAQPLSLTLSVGRVVPRKSIGVQVTIDATLTRPTAFVLYAPPTYIFPLGTCLDVGPGLNAKILSCRRLTQENIVELQLPGEGLATAVQVSLIVTAPDAQPAQDSDVWFAVAMEDASEVGWGQAAGFEVSQMPEVTLVYAGAPSAAQYLVIIFATAENLVGGAILELHAPVVYLLSCLEKDGFNALSLPSVQSCDDSGLGIRLALSGSLLAGRYVFMVGATNPAFTPPANTFDLLLMDQTGQVVDGKIGVPGVRIIPGLYLRPATLKFGSSVKNEQSEVEVTLSLSAALDPNVLGPVRALQIAVPDRFTLVANLPILNKDGLPTPERNWYHIYYSDNLVRVDLSKSDTEMPQKLPARSYRVSFQVRNPEFWMPTINIFLISLCRDVQCTSFVATMPIAGFNFGDVAELASANIGGEQKRSVASMQRSSWFHLFVSLLLFGSRE